METAMAHCRERYPTCLPYMVNTTGPFELHRFKEEPLTSVSTLTWWQSQASQLREDIVCKSLLTVVVSSACVERMFLTFGFVQSKIRNRLGSKHAGKLVFVDSSSLRYWTPTRICDSSTGYTFTPCMGSFTSPGIDTR